MTVRQLDPEQAERLRGAPYTYECVGQTARGPVAGFHWFERTARLRRRDFDEAAAELFAWQVQARAGLQAGRPTYPSGRTPWSSCGSASAGWRCASPAGSPT